MKHLIFSITIFCIFTQAKAIDLGASDAHYQNAFGNPNTQTGAEILREPLVREFMRNNPGATRDQAIQVIERQINAAPAAPTTPTQITPGPRVEATVTPVPSIRPATPPGISSNPQIGDAAPSLNIGTYDMSHPQSAFPPTAEPGIVDRFKNFIGWGETPPQNPSLISTPEPQHTAPGQAPPTSWSTTVSWDKTPEPQIQAPALSPDAGRTAAVAIDPDFHPDDNLPIGKANNIPPPGMEHVDLNDLGPKPGTGDSKGGILDSINSASDSWNKSVNEKLKSQSALTSGAAGVASIAGTMMAAADVSEDGAKANMITVPVWGATAAVCGLICASEYTPAILLGPTTETMCRGGMIVSGLSDTVASTVIKKSALAAVGGLLQNLPALATGGASPGENLMAAYDKTFGDGTQAASEGMSKGAACLNTVIATATVGVKGYSIMEAQKAANEGKDSAKKLKGGTAVAGGGGSAANARGATGGNANSVGRQSNLPDGASTARSAASQKLDECLQSTGQARIRCAMAYDSNIPPWVTSPEFANAFQKASGMSLDTFMKNLPGDASAAQTMGAALGGTGQFGSASSIASQFAQVDQAAAKAGAYESQAARRNLASEPGGGGGSSAAKKNPANPFADVFGGIMGQFNGKKEDKIKQVKDFIFGLSQKTADQVVHDPNINLFDRVSVRYLATTPRLDRLQWISPYNRAMEHQLSVKSKK